MRYNDMRIPMDAPLPAILDLKDFTANDDDGGADPTGNGNANNNPMGNAMSMIMSNGNVLNQQADDDISDMVVNYNSEFANADPALFRDGVVKQTMAVLIGRNKPNALLIGPAGSGKTKIAEEIARRIATSDPTVPPALAKCTVFELPLSNIVAGSSLVGQLEEKAKRVLDYMEDPDNNAILFIDEIHQLSGRDHIYSRIAQIFKPALARGRIRVIGATTLQEATDLADDPAFSRRFSRIIVDELTPTQTIEVMKAARVTYFKHYSNKVNISDSVLELVQKIADRHSAPGMHRPDNALTLLDRSCADAIMDRVAQEAELAKTDPQMLATLKKTAPQVAVTEKRIRKTAMLLMTGHASRDRFSEETLRSQLDHVKGQDAAIDRIIKMLRSRDLELFNDKRPLAILMAGPSGVGKTEVARTIASVVTGNEPIMMNMTEYADAATINRIIGSPAGYVGSESHQERPLDILQSNPHQVILLDELEKADPAVQRLFMSALEEGELTTARGVTLDFSHAIILATTNAGSGKAASRALGFAPASSNKDSQVAASLSAWFDPEFLNRFQAVIQFNSIERNTFRIIVADRYRIEAARINDEHPKLSLPAELDDDTLDEIVADSYVPEFGARPALRAVKRHIEDAVIAIEDAKAAGNMPATDQDPQDNPQYDQEEIDDAD